MSIEERTSIVCDGCEAEVTATSPRKAKQAARADGWILDILHHDYCIFCKQYCIS